MATPIVLSFNGRTASFDHKKLDRSKLYGKRLRVPMDSEQHKCEKAELSEDGELIIRAGMTAQGYFDMGGNWVPSSDLVAIQDGKPLDKVPSTLGNAVEATAAAPEQLLDLKVSSVYLLDPLESPDDFFSALDDGKILSFPFNYRADYHAETAFLIKNSEGLFAIVGNPVETPWLELNQVLQDTDSDEDDDELDFEMF